MTTTFARHRHISDWLGFMLFGLWAALTFSKMPAAAVLLSPTFLFEILVSLSFLIRDQPKASLRSPRARLSAYGGSFVMILFVQVAGTYRPDWFVPRLDAIAMVGTGLWLIGSFWTLYAIWHLRWAFSIEPAARRLITSGPYSFARHPVYASYFLQYLGMWLCFPTLGLAVALIAWSLLMADRMYLEEKILASTFPDYADYRQRVGALCPIPFRRVPPAVVESV